MNSKTNTSLTSASMSDIVKITERENSGVRSLSLARIAVGYVLSGTKYLYCNDYSYSIEEGGVFVLDVGFHYEENIVGANGRFEQITFYISAQRLQEVIFGLNINYGLSYASRHSCTRCMSRSFANMVASVPLRNFFVGIDLSLRSAGLLHNDVGQRIKLNELVYLLLSEEDGCIRRKILRSADTESGQFISVIYDNIFNDISVETLAELTNRSLTSFKKEFKRLFHASPHRWIVEQRLDRAKILLVSTSRTVSEIGTECAFANISHFIKLFRQRYNETPASFRRKYSVPAIDTQSNAAVG
ncbi:MAG: helix-turn-helix transcriptional regulator [Alistipes sp.]|nr:helix-turn-helix transcriptional regulator [Alistipes sp.]